METSTVFEVEAEFEIKKAGLSSKAVPKTTFIAPDWYASLISFSDRIPPPPIKGIETSFFTVEIIMENQFVF